MAELPTLQSLLLAQLLLQLSQDADDQATAESATFTQELKKRFIEGGPRFHGDRIDMFDSRISHRY